MAHSGQGGTQCGVPAGEMAPAAGWDGPGRISDGPPAIAPAAPDGGLRHVPAVTMCADGAAGLLVAVASMGARPGIT
jgi:hypothetical protein